MDLMATHLYQMGVTSAMSTRVASAASDFFLWPSSLFCNKSNECSFHWCPGQQILIKPTIDSANRALPWQCVSVTSAMNHLRLGPFSILFWKSVWFLTRRSTLPLWKSLSFRFICSIYYRHNIATSWNWYKKLQNLLEESLSYILMTVLKGDRID